MSSEGENRERDLENLLGQFLVASFQSNKLSEMIHERFSFRGRTAKEMKLLLPSSAPGKGPLLVTLRIEPAEAAMLKQKKRDDQKGMSRIISVMESPPLPSEESNQLKGRLEEILDRSFSWWRSQSVYADLKFDDWNSRVSMIDAQDSKEADEMHRILDALEAKRKGEEVASP